jgi:hypothetical protein
VFSRFGAARAFAPLLAFVTLSSTLTGCSDAPAVDSPVALSSSAGSPAPDSSAPDSSAPDSSKAPVDPAATAETVKQLKEKLADARKGTPYSARLTLRSMISGHLAVVMRGRVNMNTADRSQITGRFKLKTTVSDAGEPPLAVEEVFAGGAYFVRTMKQAGTPAGPWKRVPASAVGGSPIFSDTSDYANLILQDGPSAVKGQERRGGVLATRLSGRIKTKQIRRVEADLYDRLRTASVKSFLCDIWIDEHGRMIRLEQRLRLQGHQVYSVMTLSAFRRPVTVTRPTN